MAYDTYTVKRGDSLSKIAKQLGLGSWRELYELNKSVIGSNPNLIYSGQTYNIPGTQAVAKPSPAPVQTSQTIAEQYAAPIVEQAQNIGPSFQEVMPFYDAWERLVPQATNAAASQVNPEVMRGLKTNMYDYMNNLTARGGQRFGRGLSGVGDIRASAERDRQAQLQDWLNQYRQGFSTLFYEPSQEAWNRATTQGGTPDESLKNMPGWDEYAQKYGQAYGTGESVSPIYG